MSLLELNNILKLHKNKTVSLYPFLNYERWHSNIDKNGVLSS